MAPKIVKFQPDAAAAGGFEQWPELFPDRLETPPPARQGRVLVADVVQGVEAGVSLTGAHATKAILRDRHLFCLLVEGTVTVTAEDGTASTFSAGDAFVLPAGMTSSWRQDGPVLKYFMSQSALPSDAGAAAAAIRIDPASELQPSAPPADDLLLGPRPSAHIVASYATPDRRWSAGIWSATPYHRKLMPFPRFELMHLLEGEVSFTEEDGNVVRFAPGDTFIIPQGAVCDWKNEQLVTKVYCVFRPS